MEEDIKTIGHFKHYIIPFLATIGMIFFAILYEPVTPLWWIVATVVIAVGYGYFFKKAQKTKENKRSP